MSPVRVRSPRRILLLHVAGFAFLAAFGVGQRNHRRSPPHFGAARSTLRLEELVLEVGAVVLVGSFVVAWIARTVRRVTYLETFIVLCAWCRRVRLDQSWLSLEAYLAEHNAVASHGLCPDCQAKLEATSDTAA